MPQGQQELTTSGVAVQKRHILPQALPDQGPVIPGEVVFLLKPALKMGEIPAVDMGPGLLLQPEGFPRFGIHEPASFLNMKRQQTF